MKKTGKKLLLDLVKKKLEDVKLLTTLKVLSVLGRDLSSAIVVSQNLDFGMMHLSIVEDARHTLENSSDLCDELLRPIEELADDGEYKLVREDVKALVCVI